MRLSFVVMAYNQDAFIREAVSAAFAQDHDDLEIVLTDDGSTDGTFQIMEAMAQDYAGPHRVFLNRNDPNRGLIGHVNQLFSLATSDWVIYAAGDDISEPDRASRVAAIIGRESPLLVHSNVTDLDESGAPKLRQRDRTRHATLEAKSLPELACATSHAIGASCCWHRDLFDRFGPITETGLFEDQVLLFRARLLGKVAYLDERLVQYRRRIGLSASGRDGPEKVERSIAVLRQREADVLKVAPERSDILAALRRKLGKRIAERASAAEGKSAPSDGG
jgi:glycosyltransferase involved in cell wall biosynthesis